MTKDLEKYFDIVKIEGYRIPFKVDSEKVFTFISQDKFFIRKIPVQLQNSNIAIRSYTGNVFFHIKKL